MLLYFNGDSFAAGVELADDMLPGYPGCFTWPVDYDSDPVAKEGKEWLDNSHDGSHPSNKTRMSIVHELTQTELARAYPNLVHKMTGLPFISVPCVPPDCMYNSAFSRAQSDVLGSYSPVSGISSA